MAAKHWTTDDESLLLMLWKRKKPAAEIASLLDRTERACKNRIRDQHPQTWEKVDHPDNPRKRAPAQKLPPDQDMADVRDALSALSAKIDGVRELLLLLDGRLQIVQRAATSPMMTLPETDVPPQEPLQFPRGKAAD